MRSKQTIIILFIIIIIILLLLLLLMLFLFQSCCRIFDATTAEGIQDLCRKSLRRLATQEEDPDEFETFFSSVDQG